MDKDLSIDYLAYAFMPNKTAYLFDWRILKRVWSYYKTIWLDQYFIAEAKNYDNNGNHIYTTKSVCVPLDVLINKCSGASIIKVK